LWRTYGSNSHCRCVRHPARSVMCAPVVFSMSCGFMSIVRALTRTTVNGTPKGSVWLQCSGSCCFQLQFSWIEAETENWSLFSILYHANDGCTSETL